MPCPCTATPILLPCTSWVACWNLHACAVGTCVCAGAYRLHGDLHCLTVKGKGMSFTGRMHQQGEHEGMKHKLEQDKHIPWGTGCFKGLFDSGPRMYQAWSSHFVNT